jgi:hypothetical protein
MSKFSDTALSFKEIYLAGIKTYAEAFPKVWIIAFINGIVSAVGLYVRELYMPIIPQKAAITASTANMPPISPHDTALFWGWNVVFALVAVLFFAILLQQVFEVIKGEKAGLLGSVKFVLSKASVVIIASLITLFLAGIGFLLFLLPGIYLYVLFIFTVPYILIENKGVFAAIAASVKLVWGKWIRTFVVMLPITAIFVLFTGVALKLTQGSSIGFSIASGIIAFLFVPFFTIYILYQFNDLRIRKANKIASKSISAK